jgi:hypothetical protein
MAMTGARTTATAAAGAAMVLVMTTTLATAASAQQTVTLPARDAVLRDQPATLFTVGTVEGRDWEMFSGIRAVAFDRADRLYVLDGQNSRVVVFDADGRYVRQFGSRGGGPGEFQAPLAMTVLANDEIVVNDIGNRAYIVFSRDGEYLRSIAYHASVGMPAMSGLHAHPLGVVSRANPRPPGGPGAPPPPSAPGASQVPRMSAVYVQPLREEIAPISLYEVPLPPPLEMGDAGRRMVIMMDPVFAARPTLGVLPDGSIAVHHEAEYTVRVLDRNGRHVRNITRGLQPRRVTKKDQDEYMERRRNGDTGSGTMVTSTMGGGGGGAAISFGSAGGGGGGGAPAAAAGAMRSAMDNVPFADVMSVVTGIRTDPQSRIWVQRRNDDGTERGPIDLVVGDGRYIGTLPAQALPDAVSGSDRAAWIVRDEIGVERVAVRRLPAGWR